MHKQRPTVGILLFDDVEALDCCGPFEVFSTARLVDAGKQGDEHRLFGVFTIAEQDRILSCRGNLLVQPHTTIQQHPPLDILVVPRRPGHATRATESAPARLDRKA